MSQSAENQFAIIENENNFNIDVESQAAETEFSHSDVNIGDLPIDDIDPGTPTQDERMDVDEGQRYSAVYAASQHAEEMSADNGDRELKEEETKNYTEEEATEVSPTGDSQGAVDFRSLHHPTEASEKMEVDECEHYDSEPTEGFENEQNEPDFTDENYGQVADENAQDKSHHHQAEPGSCHAEADSELADVPGSSSQAEEDLGIPLEDTKGQQVECKTGKNPNQSVEDEDRRCKIDIPLVSDGDSDLISGEVEQAQQDEGARPRDDQNPQMCDNEQDEQDERIEDDQQMAMDETEQGQQNEDDIYEDQLLSMSEVEQDEQNQSESIDENQHLAFDEAEQGVEDENENEQNEQLESERTESDEYMATNETAQEHQAGDQYLGEESSQDLAEDSPDTHQAVANSQTLYTQNHGGDSLGFKKGDAQESNSFVNDASEASRDSEITEMDKEASKVLLPNTQITKSKSSDPVTEITESKSSDSLDKGDDYDMAMDPETDRASDATIVEGRDIDDEPLLQVTDAKSGADAEEERPDSAGDVNPVDTNMDTSVASEGTGTKTTTTTRDSELPDSQTSENVVDRIKKDEGQKKVSQDVGDDDVMVLDDGESTLQMKKENGEEVLNSNNDMGIQIESVSGGASDVHGYSEPTDIKQESDDQKPQQSSATPQTDPKGSSPSAKKSRNQTCIVCKKVGKCKYNIVRNGDIKHLCDDVCFKRFRANPTQYLKGTGKAGANSTAGSDKKGAGVKSTMGGSPAAAGQGVGKASVPGYKTCFVCLVMNINTQGQFCIWKGLDFCGEGCLGKFQSRIGSDCARCSAFIPLASRSNHCLRVGGEMKPFCSSRCHADYKLRQRLCTHCQKDAASVPDDTFFNAPVSSDGKFKEFCSQTCMKKFEELLSTDVEIIRTEPSKPRSVNICSICQKKEMIKYIIKYKGAVHNLCKDPCLSAFQFTNKLDLKMCNFCSSLCTMREASIHTAQFEGHQKHFCSDTCVTKFRFNNHKMLPCSWCGSQRDNFDMIERMDSASKYQLFCSLNCLSLYRVNLQAKSNQPIMCDQCSKRAPAQYHLTMSDASVRNFCTYNCVMTFQAQFSKRPTAPPPGSAPVAQATPPRHKHNTRGRASRGKQQAPTTSPSFPLISNVISLSPQGGQQQVNIKNSTGMPVVVSGANQSIMAGANLQAAMQQQIIVQPPPPKPVKNKSIMCKPFVQTKATSCRPHTQSKECQTDEIKEKPALLPVPVPVHLPSPMALYSAPAPTPIFIPIPIPVPIFIPTTRKSASSILKQIKTVQAVNSLSAWEIREKTPSDPLEAELLMMAAAVSADSKNSSDSESEEEMLPEINRSRKRSLPVDDEDDADVMPLTSNKEEVSGEEDMISMALRMAEEMSGPITDLESAVEAIPVNTEPPPQPPRPISPDTIGHEEEMIRNRRGGGASKRGGIARGRGAGCGAGGGGGGGSARPPKRPRIQVPQPEPIHMRQEPLPPPPPPADANYHLKFTYGVNAWRHWVLFKNNQIERNIKPGCGRVKLFKTDIMQCTADELNFSLCLFVKEVRKPNGEEYSPDSIYYLCLGIQQYLFENGRIDNIFTDFYYEKFTECLTQILSKCQPKFNASGQMVCRIEEEHLWECKQLGAHSPYVLLNTLIYFHTKYFMLKTPEDHMKLSFAHILKYWKKGQPGKGGQPARSVSLRYYSVSTAKKDGSAPTSATKKGSKDGIPVYEVTENQENPLRCPVKLYEFYLSKCPESIKNRSDIFYPVPERSCVPDSPVWYSTMPISLEAMTKMLTRILLVREIQEAHLHAQPIYV